MYDDMSKQNYAQKSRPFTSVASEASIHRQKIASLRSSFLSQPGKSTKNISTAISSSASIPVNQSSNDKRFEIHTSRSHDSIGNNLPLFKSRFPELANHQEPYSPKNSNAVGNLLTTYYPCRLMKEDPRSISNAKVNALHQVRQPINSLRMISLTKSELPEPEIVPGGCSAPHWTDSKSETIFYETLASVRSPDSRNASSMPFFPHPSFRNSMLYHHTVVQPTAQYQSVLTMSPSDSLCLYAARQDEYCRSCQRLTNSRASSFHRSSSRHSVGFLFMF